nr:queuosine precursor transporter [Propionibacterium sp.]
MTPGTSSDSGAVRFGGVGVGHYDVILALFCGLLLISNVAATKLIEIGGLPLVGSVITDGGALLFPLTYVLGDVLAEVYGLRRTHRAIALGFVLAALMSLTFLLVDAAPPASSWPYADAWHAVLGFVPRIVLASLAGYVAGQLLNAHVLVWLKRRTRGRGLGARLVTSTLVGELADTVVFCLVAFGPVAALLDGFSLPWPELLNYIVVGWLFKCLVEIALLPVTYRVIAWVGRREPG